MLPSAAGGKQKYTRQIQDAKRRGMMPKGEHSCFGNFPQHLMPGYGLPRSRRALALISR